jgi:hypothetical protein
VVRAPPSSAAPAPPPAPSPSELTKEASPTPTAEAVYSHTAKAKWAGLAPVARAARRGGSCCAAGEVAVEGGGVEGAVASSTALGAALGAALGSNWLSKAPTPAEERTRAANCNVQTSASLLDTSPLLASTAAALRAAAAAAAAAAARPLPLLRLFGAAAEAALRAALTTATLAAAAPAGCIIAMSIGATNAKRSTMRAAVTAELRRLARRERSPMSVARAAGSAAATAAPANRLIALRGALAPSPLSARAATTSRAHTPYTIVRSNPLPSAPCLDGAPAALWPPEKRANSKNSTAVASAGVPAANSTPESCTSASAPPPRKRSGFKFRNDGSGAARTSDTR